MVESIHTNFYDKELDWAAMAAAWEDSERLVNELPKELRLHSNSYTIKDEDDQRRLASLMGVSPDSLPIGKTSAVGFSPGYRLGQRLRPSKKGKDWHRRERALTQESIDSGRR